MSCTKLNSEWIKDLNVRPETVKQLKESTGEKLHTISVGNDFLDVISKAQTQKQKIDKWYYIKL